MNPVKHDAIYYDGMIPPEDAHQVLETELFRAVFFTDSENAIVRLLSIGHSLVFSNLVVHRMHD